MKRKSHVITAIVLCFAVCLSLAGCGGKEEAPKAENPKNAESKTESSNQKVSAKVNEDYYEWKDDLITELTSEGKEQTALVIPARCKGFWGGLIDGKVETVTFEDDDDIELDQAFTSVHSVKKVTLPANLTVIPFRCFATCDALEEITVPANVKELGEGAFKSCDSLKTVDLSETGIKELPDGAFGNCEALTEIKLPEGLEKVCGYAFEGCSALKSVTIPGSVKALEASAFLNTGITDVYFDGNIADIIIDKGAFGNDYINITAHVKAGSWMDQNKDAWDIPFKEVKAE